MLCLFKKLSQHYNAMKEDDRKEYQTYYKGNILF